MDTGAASTPAYNSLEAKLERQNPRHEDSVFTAGSSDWRDKSQTSRPPTHTTSAEARDEDTLVALLAQTVLDPPSVRSYQGPGPVQGQATTTDSSCIQQSQTPLIHTTSVATAVANDNPLPTLHEEEPPNEFFDDARLSVGTEYNSLVQRKSPRQFSEGSPTLAASRQTPGGSHGTAQEIEKGAPVAYSPEGSSDEGTATCQDDPLAQHTSAGPSEVQDEILPEARQAAVDTILRCLQYSCSCEGTSHAGVSLSQVATLMSRATEALPVLDTKESSPLSLPRTLNTYPNTPTHPPWEALLTGVGLDPTKATDPPTLDFNASEQEFQLQAGRADIEGEFDVDSVIFQASSLGVFYNDVEWSFRPSYVRTKQPNQRITFPGVDMQENKCLLACVDARWECFIFFPNMPHRYTDSNNREVYTTTQHLDDYTLGVWTDQVLLPAMDAVFARGSRHHYPFSFEEIRTKSNVKSESSIYKFQANRPDVRIPVSSGVLHLLWDNILERVQNVPGTCLPSNAFLGPVLIIQNHNMKLHTKHSQFHTMRQRFLQDLERRWNAQYLEKDKFWLDLGFERFDVARPATLLRKAHCNKWWASQFSDPREGAKAAIKVAEFPWAATTAASISVEIQQGNFLRDGGIAYCKGYNINKEQFATQVKSHHPFSNPLFEILAYTEEQMQTWAQLESNQGVELKLNRSTILRNLQFTKERIYSALEASRHAQFGDRQEYRIQLATFEALPIDTTSRIQATRVAATGTAAYHHGFWSLSTDHVAKFRMAECNRWLFLLEKAAHLAEQEQGTGRHLLVEEQEINSLASTAAARMLRFSIGCLDPLQLPSIWYGKRWVKSRFQNRFRNTVLAPEPTFQKRQGLAISDSIDKWGMSWLPHDLAVWTLPVPHFDIVRYPHLEIGTNTLRPTLRTSTDLLTAKTKEGKMRDFIRMRLREQTKETPIEHDDMSELLKVLAQMCIQEYNLAVIEIIKARWLKHRTGDSAHVDFYEKAGLSEEAKRGTEILCYEKLERYFGRSGLCGKELSIAWTKRRSRAKHYPTWSSGLWFDRVRPLFQSNDGSVAQPNWAQKSRYVKKVDEIMAFFRELEHPELPFLARDLKSRFQRQLCECASLYVQAILHYEWDKESTLAKVSPYNGDDTSQQRRQETELQRTKWMFPKFHPRDMEAFNIDAGTASDNPVSAVSLRAMSLRWLTMNEDDLAAHQGWGPPDAMVRNARLVGAVDETMSELEHFINEFEQWSQVNEDYIRGIGKGDEDNDWPPRPDGHTSVARNDLDDLEDTLTIDG